MLSLNMLKSLNIMPSKSEEEKSEEGAWQAWERKRHIC